MSITIQPAPAGKLALTCKRCRRRFEMEPRRVYRWLTIHLRGCIPPEQAWLPPRQAPRTPNGGPARWTPAEDRILLTHNTAAAAQLLGRTTNACRQRRSLLRKKETQ